MPAYWVLTEDPSLARMVTYYLADSGEVHSGDLSIASFGSAPPPDIVVWVASEASENALERGLALLARVPHPRRATPPLLFVAQPGAQPTPAELAACVDDRALHVLEWPVDAEDLAAGLDEALARGPRPPTLRQRAQRSWVTASVERLYADLDLPALRHAIDPRNAARPVLLVGESGTRRGLLARYVHDLSEPARDAFLGIGLEAVASGHVERELLSRSRSERVTVYLPHLDRASRPLQLELAHVFEASGLIGVEGLRFVASATRPRSLAPAVRGLPWLRVDLPPLRARADLAELARALVEARAAAVGRRVELSAAASDLLADHAWPGNLRELEATLDRALQRAGAEIDAEHLDLGGVPMPSFHVRSAEASQGATPEREDTSSATDPAAADGEVAAVADEADLSSAATTRPADSGAAADPDPNPGVADAQAAAAVDPGVAERCSRSLAEPAQPLDARAPEPEGGSGTTAGPDDAEAPSREEQLDEADGPPGSGALELSPLIAPLGDAIRQPLLALRTSAHLFQQRPHDPTARDELTTHVDRDLARIEGVISIVERFSGMRAPKLEPVDVATLLVEALARIVDRVRDRSIVLLRELDEAAPAVEADPAQLLFAIGGLLDCALRMIPVGGDLYVGSRYQPERPGRPPGHRVLIRFHSPEEVLAAPPDMPGPQEPVEVVIARHVIERMHGVFAVDASSRQDNVILIELPA